MTTDLEEISPEECMELLASHPVARIAYVDPATDWPVVVPVNVAVVDRERNRWIALRTRQEGVLDRPGARVAVQIDGVDPVHRTGWSVLVRGTLHDVDPAAAGFDDRFDPHPWLDERDRWLVVEPAIVSGRRLRRGAGEWAFAIEAYL